MGENRSSTKETYGENRSSSNEIYGKIDQYMGKTGNYMGKVDPLKLDVVETSNLLYILLNREREIHSSEFPVICHTEKQFVKSSSEEFDYNKSILSDFNQLSFKGI